ncbi:hypothetical protein ACIBSV_46635 [Embleya sp. NPDC050154]|uniref:hypothetical protein n=1 Tax=Embleya sp. NPDC050154 TaxID=3363988 RepID=UPI0037957E74
MSDAPLSPGDHVTQTPLPTGRGSRSGVVVSVEGTGSKALVTFRIGEHREYEAYACELVRDGSA